MLQPTSYLVPHSFAVLVRVPQEPKSAPDTPVGPAGGANTQAPGGPQGPQAVPPPCGLGDSNMFLFMALGLGLMYFLVMRPEQKRRKEQQAMLGSMKAGDHVVTLGGMHGTIASLTEKTVTLRVDTMKMTFDRSAITRIERDEPPAAEARKA